MTWIKSSTPKIHGTEKRSIFPISLYYRFKRPAPIKVIFENFVSEKYTPEIIPKPTPIFTKGRRKVANVKIDKKDEISRNDTINPFKIKDEFNDFILNENISISVRPKIKKKLAGSKSNRVKGVNYKKSHVFDSYRSDVRNLPASIFSTALDIIMKGVVSNKFTFEMPRGVGIIKINEITRPTAAGNYFNKLKNVTPEDILYKVYAPTMSFYASRKNKDVFCLQTTLFMSSHYLKIFEEECKKLHGFNPVERLTIKELIDQLLLTYYDVPRSFIRNCLYHGFRFMRVYIRFGITLRSARPAKFGKKWSFASVRTSFKNSRMRLDGYTGAKRMIRRMYKYRRSIYNGFYYTCLSDHEMINIKQFELINKKLYLCKEEAMLDPLENPHIVAIRIPPPLNNKLKFNIYKNINYAQDDIEYIWRWDGSRFRTTNYSEYSFNRLS